jgi:DNA gyrase subunit A
VRRTEILESDDGENAPAESTVADEDVLIAVSHEGFVKRIPVHLYRRRVGAGGRLAGMENYQNDWLERVFTARTRGWLLAFTEGGRAYFLSVLDAPESARASRGQSIYALTNAAREDRIVALVPVDTLDEKGKVLLFVTREGSVKRTPLSEFSNPRAGGVIAAGVRKGDAIVEVVLSDDRAEVLLFSRLGRAIRFPENDIPLMGRSAQGVKGIGLRDDDAVVGVVLVRRDAAVLTLSDTGWGKRTSLAEFPLQKGGGLGTHAVPAGADAGRLVAGLEVVPSDEVAIVTAAGEVLRTSASKIPEQGRRTRGVRIAVLEPGDRVVEVGRSIGEQDVAGVEADVEAGAPDGDLELLQENE